MKTRFLALGLLSIPTVCQSALATTCTVSCYHEEDRYIYEDSSSDAGFDAYCRSLGGQPGHRYGGAYCVQRQNYSTTESGNGDNSYEATKNANVACKSYQSGGGFHRATPTNPQCY